MSFRRTARAAMPLIGLQGLILVLGDPSHHLIATMALLSSGVLILGWAYGGLRETASPNRQPIVSRPTVLFVALLLRLLALPLAPTLSHDLDRYLWDGRVVAAGFDPYSLPPSAAELEPLRDELWSRLDHRQVATVYPPAALGLFSIAGRLPSSGTSLKTLLALFDGASCLLLLGIAARSKIDPAATVWYCWNPLIVFEISGMGHVEGFAVFWLVLAVYLVSPRLASDSEGSTSRAEVVKAVGAGLAIAVGTLAKLVPFLALPFLFRSVRRGWPRWALTLAAGLPVAGLCGVALWRWSGPPPGLRTYALSWEFAGPLYEPIWRSLSALGVEAPIKALLAAIEEAVHRPTWLDALYPFVYPQLLAKLVLGGVFVALLWQSRRKVGWQGVAAACGALLVCSSTFYPWYLAWLLPWAALTQGGRSGPGSRARAQGTVSPWLVASATLPWSYLASERGFDLFPWVWMVIWIPVLVVFGVVHNPWKRRHRTSTA